jgi:DNA replication protein DnaC
VEEETLKSENENNVDVFAKEHGFIIPEEVKCVECGKVENNTNQILMFNTVNYRCDKCLNKLQIEYEKKEKEKKENIKRKKMADRRMDFMNMLPPRYYDVCSYKEESEYDHISSIFYGGFGTGKTWKAYEIAYDLYTTLKIDQYKHITEIGLMNDIKAGFSDGTFDSRVKFYKDADLLIVDEMGKNSDSDFNKAQIFEILNYRYDWEKKTILICNCEEKKELYDILSPAILDRFRENIVFMDGQSKRYSK